jgi:putative transposase
MARLPRIDVPHLPQHILQRGNNRAACVFHADDYRWYLEVLHHAAQTYACRIHAYVLMTNHVHLLVTGMRTAAISSLMQSLGRRYVRYVNTTYGRTGTLWEGRFKSSVIESERYVLTCSRYMEWNPVRAGMVADPSAYRWSSYRHHALGQHDRVIHDHEVYLALGASVQGRCQAYRALCTAGLGAGDLQAIRDHVNKGRVRGSGRFQGEIAAMLKRHVKILPPGRPPKQETETPHVL